MNTRDLISIQQFCEHYGIPVSFLNSLHEFELIEVITTNKTQYIHKKQIITIEKMIRLHYELDINLEVMDVIYNLLQQVEELQKDITLLRNRLNFYEKNN